MPKFHFSVGNSSDGHIGLCAQVKAKTKVEAAGSLRLFVDLVQEAKLHELLQSAAQGFGIEYCNVYLNGDAFKPADIDEVILCCAECGQEVDTQHRRKCGKRLLNDAPRVYEEDCSDDEETT